MTSVLYDVPGPRARARNVVLNIVGAAVLLAMAWFIYAKFDATDQWASEKWKPLFQADTWKTFIIPGLAGTLKAFVVGAVLSVAFGLIFGVGRMSANRAISWASTVVIEFFRGIPLLLLMLFIYALWPSLGFDANPFAAVVIGLMLYNGSVIAEVIRAGVNSLPSGQLEAGLAVGLTSGQTMRFILLPQGLRAMLPAIVAQLVVVLKDTALGYIIGYTELLNQLNKLGSQGLRNMIPAAIVIGAIYIIINNLLSLAAEQLEKRTRKTASAVPTEVQAAADANATGLSSQTF